MAYTGEGDFGIGLGGDVDGLGVGRRKEELGPVDMGTSEVANGTDEATPQALGACILGLTRGETPNS